MILLDSNIFIIDRFFKRDTHYDVNRRFVERLPAWEAGISIYGLLETCGLASFNLSPLELAQWYYHFDQVYNVRVLFPHHLERTAARFFDDLLDATYRLFLRKMTFVDAVILMTAEEYSVSHLVTWNKKHFEGRTDILVMTPEEFLAAM